MSLNIKVIQAEAGKFYDCNYYNAVLLAAQTLFPNRVLFTDDYITIKDRIFLDLSLSYNEPKIYVRTYQFPIKKGQSLTDEQYEIFKINPSFRFFDAETMINYLQLKATENKFIHDNEG